MGPPGGESGINVIEAGEELRRGTWRGKRAGKGFTWSGRRNKTTAAGKTYPTASHNFAVLSWPVWVFENARYHYLLNLEPFRRSEWEASCCETRFR